MKLIKIAATDYAKEMLGKAGYIEEHPISDKKYGEIVEEDFVAGAKCGINLLIDEVVEILPKILGSLISVEDIPDWLATKKIS